VTSSEPADGKSTIASNLAIVLTQMGKQVLLIDGDLRRPCVHRRLMLPNDVGLSSYLTGHAKTDDLYQESTVPGLSVITSGPVPPNPSELLDSAGLVGLMAEAQRAGFDHVILDSPPVLNVADSIILGTRADTTLLVVRSGVTSREALSRCLDRLRQSRLAVAGAVLNAVTERSGYYYRYRYDRRPGHGRETDAQAATASGAGAVLQRTARRLRRRAGGQ
jgi:capsular exopolysaccharide synthesis family protein